MTIPTAYAAPHSMRAIQQAFDAEDKDLAFRLMEENQKAVELRAMSAFRYFEDIVTVTPGNEAVLGTFANVPGAYMAVRTAVTASVTLASGTVSYNPTPDTQPVSGFSIGATGYLVSRWVAGEKIQIVLAAGWARADATATPVDFGCTNLAWALEGKNDAV